MSPLPVARKESASLPASRLAMILPSDVETRIPPAILLTSMPPEPHARKIHGDAPDGVGQIVLRANVHPYVRRNINRDVTIAGGEERIRQFAGQQARHDRSEEHT